MLQRGVCAILLALGLLAHSAMAIPVSAPPEDNASDARQSDQAPAADQGADDGEEGEERVIEFNGSGDQEESDVLDPPAEGSEGPSGDKQLLPEGSFVEGQREAARLHQAAASMTDGGGSSLITGSTGATPTTSPLVGSMLSGPDGLSFQPGMVSGSDVHDDMLGMTDPYLFMDIVFLDLYGLNAILRDLQRPPIMPVTPTVDLGWNGGTHNWWNGSVAVSHRNVLNWVTNRSASHYSPSNDGFREREVKKPLAKKAGFTVSLLDAIAAAIVVMGMSAAVVWWEKGGPGIGMSIVTLGVFVFIFGRVLM